MSNILARIGRSSLVRSVIVVFALFRQTIPDYPPVGAPSHLCRRGPAAVIGRSTGQLRRKEALG
jgi:hypothetical protein